MRVPRLPRLTQSHETNLLGSPHPPRCPRAEHLSTRLGSLGHSQARRFLLPIKDTDTQEHLIAQRVRNLVAGEGHVPILLSPPYLIII